MSERHEFFSALLPEPHTLLGVDLRPFSIGHVLHLNSTRNAFATGQPPTLVDLVSAVFICSQTYAEFEDALRTGTIRIKTGWWSKRVTVDAAMAQWQRSIGTFDISEKCAAFSQYMESGCNHPYIMVKVKASQERVFKNGCPFVQMVKVKLQSAFGLSDAEIVDRPWGLCLWDYFTLRMFDGDIDIVEEGSTTDAIAVAQAVADELQRRIDAGEVKFD